jgi:hypothetical protein
MARQEEVILSFEVDEAEGIQSIEALTKANQKLREERKKLNLETADGQKRIKEINAQLDANNNKIKENSSALEKQRLNVGNYKSALDGVHPALGRVGEGLEAGTSGFKAMTLQALRFIATPIGAVLAALVTVFTLIKTALSQNAELMDKFENVTHAVGVVLEVVVSRVGKLGEALIALASGNFSEAINKTKEAFGGLADEIANAVAQQQLFLDASRDLEDSQRALRIETARQENVIKALVVASKNRNLSLDEQEEKLRQALKLEQDLVRQREDLARRDLVITARQLRVDKEFQQQSNETFDQYVERLLSSNTLGHEKLNQLVDKIEALEQARGSSLAFQEKVENSLAAIQEKRAAALEKQNAALAEQEALRRANARAQAEEVRSSRDGVRRQDREDPLAGAFATQLGKEQELDITQRFNDRILKDEERRNEETIKQARARDEALKALQEANLQSRLDTLASSSQAAAEIFGQESTTYKTLASAQTLISTYSAAQKAFDSLAGIPIVGPALGGVAAALAVAQGLARVAAINGIEFWTGGYTGPGGKYEPKGIVHANEVVWNQEDVAAVGGPAIANAMRPTAGYRNTMGHNYFDGGLVTNTVTQPINQQMELANVVKNLPAPEVAVKEITKVQTRVKVKEAISKR